MSVLIRFAPASLTAAQYDESIRKLEETGDFPPDGLDYHVCFGTDGNLRVSEIWDSQAAARRIRRAADAESSPKSESSPVCQS